jgi:hypothetical protein
MQTINCQMCGWEYETRSKNAKYCRVCQLLRNLTWLGNRTTTCIIKPEHEFVNLTDQREAPVCGEHDLLPRRHDVTGLCKLCGEHSTRLTHADVAICRSCLTKPDNRETVLVRLKQKQAWQAKQAREQSLA